ncbi:uncharacterized protein LOC135818998 isoform X2 [Sycon ciliatum]|uniref:uncharacterized protein LOC135818998 isoform X2 n=1 Tax=Sycon ciliatum TaxID=27933 RepID=UPI0020AABF06|eukprot:scpid80979/ scgid25162/ 
MAMTDEAVKTKVTNEQDQLLKDDLDEEMECFETVRSSITIGNLLSLTISALWFAAIILGALHMHHCPAQDWLPIYSIVLGSLFLIKHIQLALMANGLTENPISWTPCSVPRVLVSVFQLAVLVLGPILVFPNYGRITLHHTDNAAAYCHEGFYKFMFALVCLSTFLFSCFSVIVLVYLLLVLYRMCARLCCIASMSFFGVAEDVMNLGLMPLAATFFMF